MNWDTNETRLIMLNSEGVYNDVILNHMSIEDIVLGCDLFNHVDFKVIDWDCLNAEIEEIREELENEQKYDSFRLNSLLCIVGFSLVLNTQQTVNRGV